MDDGIIIKLFTYTIPTIIKNNRFKNIRQGYTYSVEYKLTMFTLDYTNNSEIS